jgi:Xaa-Pro aminopeptidase
MRALMLAHDLDAALISFPPSRRYLSGYSAADGQWGETSGMVYLSQTKAYLLTDFRYKLTAMQDCPYLEVNIFTKSLFGELAEIARKDGIKRLGFEPEGMLYAWYERLAAEMEGIGLIPVKRLAAGFRMFKDQSEIKAITDSIRLMEGGYWMR